MLNIQKKHALLDDEVDKINTERLTTDKSENNMATDNTRTSVNF